MPVGDHLQELRWRITAYLATLVGGVVIGFAFADQLLGLLNRPLQGRFEVVTLSVTEPFFTTLTVAAFASFAATFPLLVWHAYQYLAPALPPDRRRIVRNGALVVPGLFYAGVAFCYLVVLGPAVRFLLGLGDGRFEVQVRAGDYYSFVTLTMVALGIGFLYPLVLVVLGRVGVIDSSWLRRNRRYAVLVIAFLTALLLPTIDPVSLLLEMIPLLLLYELSILLLARQERRHPPG